MIYKYFRLKRIKCNGKKCLPNHLLSENDIIELYINDEHFAVIEKNIVPKISGDVNVIFEDDNILIADKPTGILSHNASGGDSDDNILDRIINYLAQKGEIKSNDSFLPVLCNRLDRNTSGLIICAKNNRSAREINAMIKNNSIKKHYLTVAVGYFNEKEKICHAFWQKDNSTNTVTVSDLQSSSTKEITTGYKVLSEKNNLSLVEIDLITGRSHQIRAHLAFLGHPILGDTKYGNPQKNKEYSSSHQLLKAYKIGFENLNESEYPLLSYLNNKVLTCNQCDFTQKYFDNINLQDIV